MDHVWIVRPGDDNEELRYSLRSCHAHVPYDRVWIVGHRPLWLHGTGYLRVPAAGTKYAASTRNVDAALRCREISDPFVLWNDDHFALAPSDVPVVHRGLVDGVIDEYRARFGGNTYIEGMVQTRRVLAGLGYDRPLSYELHIPLVVHKAAMREALTAGAGIAVLHKRTLYGNLAGLGGDQVPDVKVCAGRPGWDRGQTWISTDDPTFAAAGVGRFIRSRLPDPSPWEAPC